MVRDRVVRPDTVIEGIEGQQILVASREAFVAEVLAAVDVMLMCGGEFTVSSQRAGTGFGNESVSVAGFITWRSGTARSSKPQPEQHVAPQTVLTAEEQEFADDIEQVSFGDDEDDEPDLDEADVEDHIPTAAH